MVAQALVLGIDAGATKTQAAIANDHNILGIGKSGSGNLHTIKKSELTKNLATAITAAIKKSKLKSTITFERVVIGMAGINSSYDLKLVKPIVHKVLKPYQPKHIQILNDVEIINPIGVTLIAGTGSHCFGRTLDGRTAKAGGLDYLLADEGSAYSIGLKILRAAVQSADGRTKFTKLEPTVLNYFKVKSIRELEPIIYHQAFTKTDIAKLAKLIHKTLIHDWRAKEIVNETLTELIVHVKAVVHTLKLKNTKFDLVVVGGVFEINAIPFLLRFTKMIKPIAPYANIVKPKQPPVWGAVQLAQCCMLYAA